MTDREQELWERVVQRGERIMELEARITALEDRNSLLENLLASTACKKCGRVSWDIPLDDYCQCEIQTNKPVIKAVGIIQSTGPKEAGWPGDFDLPAESDIYVEDQD